MARRGSEAKRREWSARLRRYDRDRGTVAEFCDAERVSIPSFYQWRRKLAPHTSTSADTAAEPARKRRLAGRPAEMFVQLVSPAAGSTQRVIIRLPNGALVRVPGGDRQLLAAAIAAAGQVPPTGRNPGAPGEDVPLCVEDATC